MFRVIKNEYGKEYGLFEFDYLGEHPGRYYKVKMDTITFEK